MEKPSQDDGFSIFGFRFFDAQIQDQRPKNKDPASLTLAEPTISAEVAAAGMLQLTVTLRTDADHV